MKQIDLITQHNKQLGEDIVKGLKGIEKLEHYQSNTDSRDTFELHQENIEVLKYKVREEISLLINMI